MNYGQATDDAVNCKMAAAQSRSSICIVSHNAYTTLTGRGNGHYGGVEWQTTLLARWLAKRGHDVSMLTWDEGGPPLEMIDGIKVIKIAPPDAGWPGVRFFHPKWTGLVRAMRLADADVYYHNCAECVTGQIAHWCGRHGRQFVYSCASNAACEVDLPGVHSSRDRLLYRYGLRRADVRIVQTETQREKMKRNFGVDSIVIRMPLLETQATEAEPSAALQSRRVLWMGRVCHVKRPDRLLEVAAACPDIMFDIVGPIYSDAYAQAVAGRARTVKNVTVHGQVGREEAARFYARAGCLCCTSEYEGFPNTFLEAWSHGLPIVSTFDPDGLIDKEELGAVVQNVSEMPEAIRSLFADRERHARISRQARNYVMENHRSDIVLPLFEQVLRNPRTAGRLAS